MAAKRIKGVKGMRDLWSPSSDRFAHIEAVAHEVFARHGFDELRLPLVERTDLFARSIGEATDIVEKEMYAFPDRRGRSLCLRPEGTAGVVRAYVQAGRQQVEPVSRLYYSGPMFRYERPQKGRYRQFSQIGAELFGAEGPLADAEVIGLVVELLEAIGVPGVSLELNSLGCRRCRQPYVERLQRYLAPHAPVLCDDCKRRIERNPMRVLDCKVEGCQAVIAEAPRQLEHLCDDCDQHFEAVKRYLADSDVRFVVNPSIVRGLDYYNRTAFELIAEGFGAQNAVGGGGRYDDLVSWLGGPDVPAVGWALGLDRLVDLLEDQGSDHPVDRLPLVALCWVGHDSEREGLRVLRSLRRSRRMAGCARFQIDVLGRSLKSQLKRASKLGARVVIILGEDELAGGQLTVRDMARGEQLLVPRNGVIDTLEQVLREPSEGR